jgi:ribosomal subunit interface protein
VEVRITGRHAEVEDRVKEYANEKLGPLSRYYDRTRYLEVVFDDDTVGKKVEVIAHMQRGKPIVATTQHKDPMAAVDLAHDKLERLLTRRKEKRLTHKRKDGGAGSAAGAR